MSETKIIKPYPTITQIINQNISKGVSLIKRLTIRDIPKINNRSATGSLH
jgi:hypothetical protein